MNDPLTGFEYPDAWVKACAQPGLLPLVSAGLAVLTAGGTVLRRGYTTGSTAAAACRAAVLSLQNPVHRVGIITPSGIAIELPVTTIRPGTVECRKYAGDYPGDVTADILFRATATPTGHGIVIEAGEGIGRFCRDTARFGKGEPAISIPAGNCIREMVKKALVETGLPGVRIELTVPEGARVAGKTLNPRLGIIGGISILGTTGLVEPWDDHLEASMLSRIQSSSRVVLTTGRTGLRYSRLYFPGYEAILVGSKLSSALPVAPEDVVLCGLPGLILRFIDPAILEGTGMATVEEMLNTGGSHERVQKALDMCRNRYPNLRVVLINREGAVIEDTGIHG